MKTALIFGITGQDGSILAEQLLDKGYVVHGVVRRSATGNMVNIEHLKDRLFLHFGDLSDGHSVENIVRVVSPAEIYNEADQDHVAVSHKMPFYSYEVTTLGVARILQAVTEFSPRTRVFQPLSSNMFGKCEEESQDEGTKINPQSPYALGKAMAWEVCKYYRNVHDLFVSCGILYNHESFRRTEDYLSRKVTRSIGRIKRGEQKELLLGDLSVPIDWGWAEEYMEAAWKILQLGKPDDFILATGELHTPKEFVDLAFEYAGLKAEDFVRVGGQSRPTRNSSLSGDYSKAKIGFGFEPRMRFREIVKAMVNYDL